MYSLNEICFHFGCSFIHRKAGTLKNLVQREFISLLSLKTPQLMTPIKFELCTAWVVTCNVMDSIGRCPSASPLFVIPVIQPSGIADSSCRLE